MTALQQDLFTPAETQADVDWRNFRRDHPFVFAEMIRITAQAKDRGETRISMKYLFEVLRKGVARDGRVVALNNSWTSCAARDLISEREDLRDMIRTRRRHT